MKKTHTLLAAYGIAVAAATSTASFADFNLGNLKAIADKVKAYSEKLKQETPAQVNAPAVQNSGLGPIEAADPLNRTTKLDIVGVKIGMSPDDAIKALHIHNPKLKVSYEKKVYFEDINKQNHTVQLILVDGGNGDPFKATIETIQLSFSLPPHVGTVQIIRDLKYPHKTGGPTIEAVLSSLRDKFGNPTKDNSNLAGSYWIWNFGLGLHSSGRIMLPDPMRYQCYPVPGPHYGGPLPKDQCGLSLFSQITPVSGNPNVAARIHVELTDYTSIYKYASIPFSV